MSVSIRPLTDEEKLLIRDEVERGATLQQIAEIFGIDWTTIDEFWDHNHRKIKLPRPRTFGVLSRSIHIHQQRKFKIVTNRNGKLVYLDAPYKRNKPDKCELCGRLTESLGYHHWNDETPSIGLWLCYPCHIFAEIVEKGKVSAYLMAKEKATREVESSMH